MVDHCKRVCSCWFQLQVEGKCTIMLVGWYRGGFDGGLGGTISTLHAIDGLWAQPLHYMQLMGMGRDHCITCC
jgi:hypothetical protein